MSYRFLFLGTGASMGVPMLGCGCSVCVSGSPKNQRLRPSALLKWKGKNLLIDCGPDFRTQALRYGVRDIDAVLFTHAHSDHVSGIDDLRAFYLHHRKAVPCLALEATIEDLRYRFYYLFEGNGGKKKTSSNLTAKLDFTAVKEAREERSFSGIPLKLFTYHQGVMPVMGFRVGDFAYVTDIKEYKEEILEDLRGVKHLVVSALQEDPNPIHFSVSDAIAFGEAVEAENIYFNHISHRIDHDKLSKSLPEHVYLSYDGMTIDLEDE